VNGWRLHVPETLISTSPRRTSPSVFSGTPPACSCWRWWWLRPEFGDQSQCLGEQHSRYGDLGHLELDKQHRRTIHALDSFGQEKLAVRGSEGGGKAAAIAYTMIETAKLKAASYGSSQWIRA
jgi:hypothetical protein